MKMNKLYKSARSIFAVTAICAALFTTLACSNIIQKEEVEQQEKQADQTKPVLNIKFDESARTVLPTCPVSALKDFHLEIQQGSADPEVLGDESYATAEDLQNAEFSLNETYVDTSCTFTLTAKTEENVGFSGSVSTKVFAGENILVFRLSTELSGDEGTNSFTLTLDYSSDTVNASKVTKAVATLYKLASDSKTSSTITESVLTGYENKELSIEQNKVVFSGADLATGNYRAIIKLYGGDNNDILVAQWIETILIAKEFPSSATRILTSLNDLYTVTYHYNADDDETLTGAVAASTVTSGSKNAIVVPERTGYLFLDWYTDEELENLFVLSDISQDMELYAKWMPVSTSSGENLATKYTIVDLINNLTEATSASAPYAIKMVGNVDASVISDIKEAMTNSENSSKYLSFDFSQVNGLKVLSSNAFYYCSRLVNIVLPETLTNINSYAFYNCSNLKSISIPASVTSINSTAFYYATGLTEYIVDENNANYKSVDGILYSKDGTILISYPAKKTNSSYTTPDSVTTIGSYAFLGTQILQSLTISSHVSTISSYAFYYCRGLSRITFNDKENIWYVDNKETSDKTGNIVFNIADEINFPTTSSQYTNNSTLSKAKNTSMKKYIDEKNPTELTIYNTESKNLSDGYLFGEIMADSLAAWYTFTTVPGSEYEIMFCDYNSRYNFETDSTNFVAANLIKFNANGKKETVSFSQGVYKFTAESEKMYLNVSKNTSYATSGNYAIRIVKLPDANLTAGIQIISVDNELTYTQQRDGTLRFTINDAGESFTWSVDKKTASTSSTSKTFDFDPSLYAKGLHIVSVLIKDGAMYYSRTAQIMVK